MGLEEFVTWQVRPTLWAAVALMSLVSSFVALDLVGRVPANRGLARGLWLAGSAVAMGTGIWASHFIALAEDSLPFGIGYGGAWTFAGWAFAATAAALSLRVGRAPGAGAAQRLLAGAAMASAATASDFLCFWDMRMAPALQWQLLWVAAALIVGSLGVAAGYRLMAGGRNLHAGVARHAGAALTIGLALGASHAAITRAAQVPIDAVSLSHLISVSSGMLAVLASLGTSMLLLVLMLLSVTEARMQTALARAIRRIDDAARADALTTLPNRIHFDECLELAAHAADRENRPMAVLFISLDGFKPVNDSFGRRVGDLLLQDLAKRLKAIARQGDTVARVGGDEFVLLMARDADRDSAAQMARQLLARLGEACELEGRQTSISCSIGLVLYPKHGGHTTAMLYAEAAARSVKRSGGATFAFFEPHMLNGVSEQLELLRDLRSALSGKQLELYYQPKIHAPSGMVTGAEALLRWHHPKRGIVSPGVFIPIAERHGLIGALGEWVIDEACRQSRAWRDQGLRMRVAINLSVHQLRNPDLAERIAQALARHQVNPVLLTCEITESVAMEDPAATMKVFEKLAKVGVHISIDDFGTGYSSLSILRKLPAEELKIDRSFVLDLEASADARAVVDAVVKLAQALGLKVVAEGVETEAQRQILRSLGCDELQGFLFAKPMPAKALSLWAMQDDGPSDINFRDSLFQETAPFPG